jgi:hypothetical protein
MEGSPTLKPSRDETIAATQEHTASLCRVRRLCIQAQRSVNLSLHICNLPVTGLGVVFWYDKIGIGEFISTGGMTCLAIDKR